MRSRSVDHEAKQANPNTVTRAAGHHEEAGAFLGLCWSDARAEELPHAQQPHAQQTLACPDRFGCGWCQHSPGCISFHRHPNTAAEGQEHDPGQLVELKRFRMCRCDIQPATKTRKSLRLLIPGAQSHHVLQDDLSVLQSGRALTTFLCWRECVFFLSTRRKKS